MVSFVGNFAGNVTESLNFIFSRPFEKEKDHQVNGNHHQVNGKTVKEPGDDDSDNSSDDDDLPVNTNRPNIMLEADTDDSSDDDDVGGGH